MTHLETTRLGFGYAALLGLVLLSTACGDGDSHDPEAGGGTAQEPSGAAGGGEGERPSEVRIDAPGGQSGADGGGCSTPTADLLDEAQVELPALDLDADAQWVSVQYALPWAQPARELKMEVTPIGAPGPGSCSPVTVEVEVALELDDGTRLLLSAPLDLDAAGERGELRAWLSADLADYLPELSELPVPDTYFLRLHLVPGRASAVLSMYSEDDGLLCPLARWTPDDDCDGLQQALSEQEADALEIGLIAERIDGLAAVDIVSTSGDAITLRMESTRSERPVCAAPAGLHDGSQLVEVAFTARLSSDAMQLGTELPLTVHALRTAEGTWAPTILLDGQLLLPASALAWADAASTPAGWPEADQEGLYVLSMTGEVGETESQGQLSLARFMPDTTIAPVDGSLEADWMRAECFGSLTESYGATWTTNP